MVFPCFMVRFLSTFLVAAPPLLVPPAGPQCPEGNCFCLGKRGVDAPSGVPRFPKQKPVLRPTTARPPADAGWVAAGRARPFRVEGGRRGGWPGVLSREDVAGRRGWGCGGAKLPLTPP